MALQYMTPQDVHAIRAAASYSDLREVGLAILNRMPTDREIGMVCGPISTGGFGDPELNLFRFNQAIEVLIASGYLLFNQMPFESKLVKLHQPDHTGYDNRILLEFYEPLFASGRIAIQYFIHGWQASTGAVWEHDQAERRGVRIIYLDESHRVPVAV